MAIQLNLPTAAQPNTQAASSDRPRAEVYVNVGIVETSPVTGEKAFISLGGFALDTMTKPENYASKNEDYNWMMGQRAALIEAAQEAMTELKPGQEQIIGDSAGGGLCIQIRRLEAKRELPTAEQSKVTFRSLFASA